MTQENQIEIPLSKKKMLLSLLGSLLFIGIGSWFLVKPPEISNPVFGNPTLIFVMGITAIVFFGLVLIIVLRKLFEKSPGLIINNNGIIDNSSGVSAGLIIWSDIQEIRTIQVMNQSFLVVIVSNPSDYIGRVSNPIKRKGMELNHRNYGSPITISAHALQTDFPALASLLANKLKESKV